MGGNAHSKTFDLKRRKKKSRSPTKQEAVKDKKQRRGKREKKIPVNLSWGGRAQYDPVYL